MSTNEFDVDSGVEAEYTVYAPETFSYVSPDDDPNNTYTHFHFDAKHNYFTSLILDETQDDNTDEFESFVTIVVEELLQSRFNYTLQQLYTATEEYLEDDGEDKIIINELRPMFTSYDDINVRELSQVIEGIYYKSRFENEL